MNLAQNTEEFRSHVLKITASTVWNMQKPCFVGWNDEMTPATARIWLLHSLLFFAALTLLRRALRGGRGPDLKWVWKQGTHGYPGKTDRLTMINHHFPGSQRLKIRANVAHRKWQVQVPSNSSDD